MRISGKEKKKGLDKIVCKWYHLIIKEKKRGNKNEWIL